MSTTELIEMIKKMPADQQKEVEDFVLSKINDEESIKHLLAEPQGNNGRGYGSLKGFITYISDDFDEPLDDFKDYM